MCRYVFTRGYYVEYLTRPAGYRSTPARDTALDTEDAMVDPERHHPGPASLGLIDRSSIHEYDHKEYIFVVMMPVDVLDEKF
jgi:hypothetical protein